MSHEKGALGRRGDQIDRLVWKVPGTRRVWYVVLSTMVTTTMLFPFLLDDAGWAVWVVMAILCAVAFAIWLVTATRDLTIQIDGTQLIWTRGRHQTRLPLSGILDVDWKLLDPQRFVGSKEEEVHHLRLEVRTKAGVQYVDGLSIVSAEMASTRQQYRHLLTADDYDTLCADIREAASRARPAGSETDIPQAMRKLTKEGPR